ncbi:unnamed protein product [Leuciscus chuanchicus]
MGQAAIANICEQEHWVGPAFIFRLLNADTLTWQHTSMFDSGWVSLTALRGALGRNSTARESPQPPVIASGPRCRWHIRSRMYDEQKIPPQLPVLKRQKHELKPFSEAGEAEVGTALCRQEGQDRDGQTSLEDDKEGGKMH